MFSSRECCLTLRATITVIGPNRPKNIQIINTTLPAAERYGVIPAVTPTVPAADEHSNIKSKNVWGKCYITFVIHCIMLNILTVQSPYLCTLHMHKSFFCNYVFNL